MEAANTDDASPAQRAPALPDSTRAPAQEDRAFREEVLDWLSRTGRGFRAAGKRFGVPAETIGRWAHLARVEVQIGRLLDELEADDALRVLDTVRAERTQEPT